MGLTIIGLRDSVVNWRFCLDCFVVFFRFLFGKTLGGLQTLLKLGNFVLLFFLALGFLFFKLGYFVLEFLEVSF